MDKWKANLFISLLININILNTRAGQHINQSKLALQKSKSSWNAAGALYAKGIPPSTLVEKTIEVSAKTKTNVQNMWLYKEELQDKAFI